MEIKALACARPSQHKLPLARLSCNDIARQAQQSGLVASISGATVWRWLSADAIRPWTFRSWIFPRDPDFSAKAERVLDLYQGEWDGRPLGPRDFVLSTDEKTSIQVRRRIHEGTPTVPGRARRVEFEYERGGALAYLAAWDVRRAKIFGRCEATTGIEAFHRLVDQVMSQEPYRSARRVFWISDNGSSHRGERADQRLAQWYPNAIAVHTPIHASWLNQVEIYFSVVQRKVLTPNEFLSIDRLQESLLAFQEHYENYAKPFEWKFTRQELRDLLAKFSREEQSSLKAAA